jgi:hypothetical protein
MNHLLFSLKKNMIYEKIKGYNNVFYGEQLIKIMEKKLLFMN